MLVIKIIIINNDINNDVNTLTDDQPRPLESVRSVLSSVSQCNVGSFYQTKAVEDDVEQPAVRL